MPGRFFGLTTARIENIGRASCSPKGCSQALEDELEKLELQYAQSLEKKPRSVVGRTSDGTLDEFKAILAAEGTPHQHSGLNTHFELEDLKTRIAPLSSQAG